MSTAARGVWLATALAAGLAVLAMAVPGAELSPNGIEVAKAAYSTDEIIVRARPGVATARLRDDLAKRGLSLGARIPHTRLFSVRTNGRSPGAAIRSLAHAALVATAMPNYVRRASEMPNDPYFASGEPYLRTIRMPQAWDLSHGSMAVTIAVVDTGVTPVADLAAQLLPGHNFVQDDEGLPDDYRVPDENDASDSSGRGHGTLVAGIAAATTNNALGIASVAWEASVLPVKVLNSQGAGTDLQIAAGIVWAVDHGASIINLSLRGFAPGTALCDTVSYATVKGVLVVAAVGNDGTGAPIYPAACPGVLAVSATDTNGDFASFSSYGPWVSIAAPGIQITSTRSDNGFGAGRGTSLAAPIVAGVAALLRAQHPNWIPAQVALQLEQTAQDRGPTGVDKYYGHGLLDAYRALGGPAQPAVPPSPDALEPNDNSIQATLLSTSARGTIAPEGDVDWYAVRVRAPGALTFQVDGPPYYARLGPNFNPVLKLYDHKLNLLARQDEGSFGQSERVTVQVPAAGRYYLRIANKTGAKSPGSYSVSVTRLHSNRRKPT